MSEVLANQALCEIAVIIQQLVFPSGIGYDKQNDRVQTKRVNSILSAIPLLTKDLDKIKSGEPINLDQFSARVTSTGWSSNFYKDMLCIISNNI